MELRCAVAGCLNEAATIYKGTVWCDPHHKLFLTPLIGSYLDESKKKTKPIMEGQK